MEGRVEEQIVPSREIVLKAAVIVQARGEVGK